MDSVIVRILKERNKARDKYGEEGLAPGGHPDFDILDYAISEVVGLIRYGQMIACRYCGNQGVHEEAIALAHSLQSFGRRTGTQLIELRKKLLEIHETLGDTK